MSYTCSKHPDTHLQACNACYSALYDLAEWLASFDDTLPEHMNPRAPEIFRNARSVMEQVIADYAHVS